MHFILLSMWYMRIILLLIRSVCWSEHEQRFVSMAAAVRLLDPSSSHIGSQTTCGTPSQTRFTCKSSTTLRWPPGPLTPTPTHPSTLHLLKCRSHTAAVGVVLRGCHLSLHPPSPNICSVGSWTRPFLHAFLLFFYNSRVDVHTAMARTLKRNVELSIINVEL